MSNIKVWNSLDSNLWPLASEATAQPTEPQPLPTNGKFNQTECFKISLATHYAPDFCVSGTGEATFS